MLIEQRFLCPIKRVARQSKIASARIFLTTEIQATRLNIDKKHKYARHAFRL